MKQFLLTGLTLALLPGLAAAQTYNADLIFSSTGELYYEAGGILNAGGGQWINEGTIVHDGPATATLVNDGAYTSQNGGLDQFTATTGAVEIAGSLAPTFYDVQFQNAGVVSLTNAGGALVTNTATFAGTLVDNAAGGLGAALRFGAAGTYAWTTGPDDTHHVNGYVGKAGTTLFTYPVGSGTDYRYVQAGTPGGMAVRYLASNPQGTASFDASLSKVYGGATWPVSSALAGGAVTVSIPAIPASFALATRLRLVGWNGTQWLNLSIVGATSLAEGSELAGTLVAGLTALGIGAATEPLPVELRTFAARAVKADAVIDWATASEKNTAYFQVERSLDGRTGFGAVGERVPAAGTSVGPRTYAQTDAGVGHAGGTFYYRLRQVDRDGAFTLSDARAVTFGPPTGWLVEAWPNPYAREARVRVTTTEAGPATVALYDATGRLIHQQTPVLAPGTTVVVLERASTLPPGAYVLRVTQGTARTSLRLVRE